MDDTSATILATLGAVTALGGVVSGLVLLRKRRGARARFYFSVRTEESNDTTRSNEPPPFPPPKDPPP